MAICSCIALVGGGSAHPASVRQAPQAMGKPIARRPLGTGECYEAYVKIHGTPAEIEVRKKLAAEGDPFSSIKGLWAGCAACHGNEGQGMGVFPKLAGQNADYISGRLYQYKNNETVGNMSSTMWAQAGMLSDSDIDTLSKFIEETMK